MSSVHIKTDNMEMVQQAAVEKHPRYLFSRMEFAGSLGDLGTLLPMALGMIIVNGIDPVGTLASIGVFFILSGMYYGLTVPVQPMKVVGAYAIATAMSPSQITASGLLIGIFLLVIGLSGAITVIGKYIPKSVIRGVQLSTGTLLMAQGVRFMVGTSKFQVLKQAAEPYLTLQSIGPVPFGILLGIGGAILTLLLLENRKFPAGLVVVCLGILTGLIFGTREGMSEIQVGAHFPGFLPFGFPTSADFVFALFAVALPQIPMTLGNAVVANADLSAEYFGEASRKVTYRSLTISMALANIVCFFVGGMPLCHGAGGLAAHYRFGARTAGSNLMIGGIFLAMALFLGKHAPALIYLLPMSLLGVLLIFAGSQLALTILDLKERKDMFTAVIILGITMAANLAVGFVTGIILAYALKSEKLKV